jgi:serine/threonine protein kinase
MVHLTGTFFLSIHFSISIQLLVQEAQSTHTSTSQMQVSEPIDALHESLYQNKYILEDCLFQNRNYLIRTGLDVTTGKRLTFKFMTSYAMFLRELELLVHPEFKDKEWMIPYVDSYQDRERNYYCIVLDWLFEPSTLLSSYLEREDLIHHQEKKSGEAKAPHLTPLSPDDRKSVIRSLLSFLADLHQQELILCDLAPHNVICYRVKENAPLQCKIVNFGTSKRVGEQLGVSKLPEVYLPPELQRSISSSRRLNNKEEDQKKRRAKANNSSIDICVGAEYAMDMWCLGLIILQLIHHGPVDRVPNLMQFVKWITQASVSFQSAPPPLLSHSEPQLERFMWTLMVRDPQKRPSSQTLLVSLSVVTNLIVIQSHSFWQSTS